MSRKPTQHSIFNMIDYLMAQVGLTREQATITINTIVQHMQKHPGDPLNKIITAMFGGKNDKNSLN